MNKIKRKKNNVAIKVENLSKTFTIPHEKITSVRGAFVDMFNRKRSYEQNKVLNKISFEVNKGDCFGVVGRNGSGKSTLLKILAGIYKQDSGKVSINGQISPFLELGIGFNPELSGRDNIYLNGSVLGLTKRQIDEKFDDIVRFSELERFMDQKIRNYSSGMQVRLAFSVSIHARRDILLMDEVLAVGDSNFKQKCLEQFNEFRNLGKTILFVSHDIGAVQRYCNKGIMLRDGVIEMYGTGDDVYNAYIGQNIKDEEERIQKEQILKIKKVKDAERRELEEKRRNRKVEIKEVKFLSSDKKERKVFSNRDDIIVEIGFKLLKDDSKINFGIGLYTQDNTYVMGLHTLLDEIDMEKYVKKGFIRVKVSKLPLKAGSYYAKVSACGNDFRPYYDFVDKSGYFKIISKNKNQEGLVDLDYKWI